MMDEDASETLESRLGIWKALARRTQSALNSDVVPCRRDQILIEIIEHHSFLPRVKLDSEARNNLPRPPIAGQIACRKYSI